MHGFKPQTANQANFVKMWEEDYDVIFETGCAGTGKTYVALWNMLNTLLEKNSQYDQLIIVRSAVESRDVGFLPGDLDEKNAIYELPYQEIIDSLFTFNHSYQNLKALGKVKFSTTSHLRGLTFDRSLILVDEFQNLDFAELDTSFGRIGEYSRIVFAGDIVQNDLERKREVSGFKKFMSIFDTISGDDDLIHGTIEYTPDDIVRSGMLKSYIKAKYRMNLS